MAGVVAGLSVVVEDFEGVVVGFLEEVLVFLGGNLGIFFFGSGMVQYVFW